VSRPLVLLETDILAALARFAHRDRGHHLAHVIARDGELVACDGHRLARVPLIVAVPLDSDMGWNGNAPVRFAIHADHLRAAIAAQDVLHAATEDDKADDDDDDDDDDRDQRPRRGRVLAITPHEVANAPRRRLIIGLDHVPRSELRTEDRYSVDVCDADVLDRWPTKDGLDAVQREYAGTAPDEMPVDVSFLADAIRLLRALPSVDVSTTRVRWSELTAPAQIRTESGVRISIMPRRAP
jgi:hypothetical protein